MSEIKWLPVYGCVLTTGNAQDPLPKWLKEGMPHGIVRKEPVLGLESKELGDHVNSNSIQPEMEIGTCKCINC